MHAFVWLERGNVPRKRHHASPVLSDITNSSLDARGCAESSPRSIKIRLPQRIQASTRGSDVEISSSLLIGGRALLLMILLLLRHERIHDLLHRFPQVVRAAGTRYRPRFRSRGSRYAARDDSLEITSIYSLIYDFSTRRGCVATARRKIFK